MVQQNPRNQQKIALLIKVHPNIIKKMKKVKNTQHTPEHLSAAIRRMLANSQRLSRLGLHRKCDFNLDAVRLRDRFRHGEQDLGSGAF